jgi:hypothetical protein
MLRGEYDDSILLRCSTELKEAIREHAKRDGKSMNKWMADTLYATTGFTKQRVPIKYAERWSRGSTDGNESERK